MKIALAILVVVACATAAKIPSVIPASIQDRSISTVIVDVIEDIQMQMPCGFPELGIPPLAPLKISYKELNINWPDLSLHGAVENFRLYGLNEFDVEEMNVNPVTSKVSFRFLFKNINVETEYDMRMMLKKGGFTINMVGAGPAKFGILDLSVWGTMKYSLGLTTGKLQFKSLDIRAHIGEVDSNIQGMLGEGVVNEKMNAVLAEAVEIIVNDNEDVISQSIQAIALPVVNNALADLSISDIVAGAGGEGSEKDACIPPEN